MVRQESDFFWIFFGGEPQGELETEKGAEGEGVRLVEAADIG